MLSTAVSVWIRLCFRLRSTGLQLRSQTTPHIPIVLLGLQTPWKSPSAAGVPTGSTTVSDPLQIPLVLLGLQTPAEKPMFSGVPTGSTAVSELDTNFG